MGVFHDLRKTNPLLYNIVQQHILNVKRGASGCGEDKRFNAEDKDFFINVRISSIQERCAALLLS